MARILSVLITASMTLGACKTREFPGNESLPLIVGGRELEPDHPGRASALMITVDGEFHCSGILVAPDLALTAAHCLRDATPTQVEVHFGDALAVEHPSRRVTELQSYRPWTAAAGPNYDVAWLRLAEKAPPEYQPVPLLVDPSRLRRGQTLTQVGYGRTSSSSLDDGRRLSVDVIFNRPIANARWRHIFVTGPAPGRGTCDGDSGGPSYVYLDGQWLLAGILFGAPSDLLDDVRCEAGQDIQVFAGFFKTWIEETARIQLMPHGHGEPLPAFSPQGGDYDHRLSAWCKAAPRLAPEPWFTLSQIMQALETKDCGDADTKMANMRSLKLSHRHLTSLAPLVGARSLVELDLAGNQLKDIGSLGALPKLERLYLEHNQIQDLMPLAALAKLQVLALHHNRIESLDAVGGLKELEALGISCNHIEDLTPIAGLRRLKTLHASFNRIAKVSALRDMPSLKYVEAFANPIDDTAAITALAERQVTLLKGPSPISDCRSLDWPRPRSDL